MRFEDSSDAGDDADEAAPDDDSPQGVFGNLPHKRPGARSPRRQAPGAGAGTGKTGGGPSPVRETKQGTSRAAGGEADPLTDAAQALRDSEPSRPRPETDAPEPDRHEGGGLEDVAWAGVAAAAEAATIGVRLATRALEAMRDAVDRR